MIARLAVVLALTVAIGITAMLLVRDGDDKNYSSGPATIVRAGVICAIGAEVSGTPCSPSSADDPVLVGAGDIAACDTAGDEATAALLDDIPGTVFTAGDNVYEDGSSEEFAECYEPSWGRHKERTRPVSGNHEYNSRDAAGYYEYFGDAAGDPDEGWYSYDLGAWHVVVLNSECGEIGGCGPGSPQMDWLIADLESSDAACTMAIWHKPILTVGRHHDSDLHLLPIWEALYDRGVDLVVNGHDHVYQRYGLMNRSLEGVAANGMRQIVVGTGGREITDVEPGRAADTPGLEVWADRSDDDDGHDTGFGVIKLTLRKDWYEWEFVPVPGGTFADSGASPCVAL